jgi:hypothetical protein
MTVLEKPLRQQRGPYARFFRQRGYMTFLKCPTDSAGRSGPSSKNHCTLKKEILLPQYITQKGYLQSGTRPRLQELVEERNSNAAKLALEPLSSICRPEETGKRKENCLKATVLNLTQTRGGRRRRRRRRRRKEGHAGTVMVFRRMICKSDKLRYFAKLGHRSAV